jgi:hypothetical protein
LKPFNREQLTALIFQLLSSQAANGRHTESMV